MKMLTKRELINNVVVAFENQFGADPKNPRWKRTGDRLRKLKLAKASEKEVEKILGNRSWTEMRCAECGQDCKEAIQLGKESNRDQGPIYLCTKCVEIAHSELRIEQLGLLRFAA